MADEVANSSAETAQTATTATTTATATHDGGEDSSADLGGLTLRALVSTKEAGEKALFRVAQTVLHSADFVRQAS